MDILKTRPRQINLKKPTGIIFKDQRRSILLPSLRGSTRLLCRYCHREFIHIASRGVHEGRCPALENIPNEVRRLRDELKILQTKVKQGLTLGAGKYWSNYIKDILTNR